MTVQARWPTLVVGWALAVAVTALIAWRAVHFVGSQFSSDVAISRPPAAASPTPGPGSGRPSPQRTPAVTPTQPAPNGPGVGGPDTPQPAPTPPTKAPGTGGPGTTPPPVVGGPGVPPVPVPRPNPQPAPSSEPPVAQPPVVQPPVAQPPGDDGGPVVAQPPPNQQPSPVPIRISDRRAVETTGGMATFTCTNVDVVALETASPAPGFEVGPVRLREDSRMDVSFVGPSEQEQRIDARCRGGALDASVN